MSMVQIDIDDALIETMGIKAVRSFMEQQLSMLRVRYLGEKIKEHIERAGFDHEKEVEKARREAWLEYKSKHLPEA